MNNPRPIAAALSALVALVIPLAACSTPSAPAEPTTATVDTVPSEERGATQHNTADTMFAQMMIIHHEGAIDMAELARTRSGSEEVRALAERISAAQGPEIEQMQSWLRAWGEPTDGGGHAGHGGMDMDGMTQDEMMAMLDGLSGADFDEAFLTGMIAHHEGAVDMAQAQLADGENPEALELAEKIIDDQEAEITEMQELLGQ